MTDEERQDLDYKWFEQNMERLYAEHGNKFVAVKHESILGVYDNFDAALQTTLKNEEWGTFLIQEIFENKGKARIMYTGTNWRA